MTSIQCCASLVYPHTCSLDLAWPRAAVALTLGELLVHVDLSAHFQAYTMDKLKDHLRRDPKYRGHVQAMDAVEAGDYKSAMKYGMYVGGCVHPTQRRRIDQALRPYSTPLGHTHP